MAVVFQSFYISTGAKNAMHTLRCSRTVEGLNPAFTPDFYIKNLAVDVTEAQEKAKVYYDAFVERCGGSDENRIFQLELEPEYDITLRRGKLSARDTLNMQTIEGGRLPFGKHDGKMIADAPNSYVLFFADKVADINADNNPVMAALAAACLGVALEKGLIAKREVARAERAEADALSQFVGEIGQRQTFTGEIVSVMVKAPSQYDNSYSLTKIRCGNDLVDFYNNQLGERGETVTFKATIKTHNEYKGVMTTRVNRPKKAS